MKTEYSAETYTYKELYEIKIVCSTNLVNKTNKVNYDFLVNPDEFEKTVLEIECVLNQFTNGRWNVDNKIFNQYNFFCRDQENFKWLKNLPNDSTQNNNANIDSYSVNYYDKNSIRNKVAISEIEPFLKIFSDLNINNKIGKYFWEEDSTKKDFDAYFYDVVSLIEKTILADKLERKLAKNDKKSPISKL